MLTLMKEVYTADFMTSDREVLEVSGETQIELLQGICDGIRRNYKCRNFGEANELTKLTYLLNSSLDSITQHLSKSGEVEVED